MIENDKMVEMRRLIFLFVCIVVGVNVYADDVRFTASAPDAVVNGDQFRLTFTINTQDVKDFRAPTISEFEVLMGPSRSQQSSTQIINGKYSSTSSITYTYILLPQKEGTFTIPGATIVANGENVTSNSLKIKVLPPDQASGVGGASAGSSASSRGGGNVSQPSSNSSISGKDLFITATASKTTVHEQEAILLTYKVYTVLNLTGILGKMPDLKGFHTQEVELPRNKTFSLEHYNGRNYKTLVWSQYVLFPQQSGKLEIPSITFEGVVAQQIQSDDPFEAFFNGGTNYVEVKKALTTPKIMIDVKPLPSGKPANFSGAVGDFSINSSINATELKTNDAITIKLVISGTGNMKLISTPEVDFPKDFDVYDPKVDNKFSLTKNGLSGNKVIEYLAIPRHAGTYKIPPIEFSYFDLKTKSYKTLKTKEFEVNVEKGKGNAEQVLADFTNKEDLKILGEDIHFIKMGNDTLRSKGQYFFGSLGYYLCYIVPLCLLIAFIIIYRKQAVENANIAKVRTKKANKIATKRMRYASRLLSENKKNEFYDEVLKALWGYISDKLNISVSQLSKDNIESELVKYGISQELRENFIGILNECEFARYAPGDESEAMDKMYASAVDIISKIENQIKHS